MGKISVNDKISIKNLNKREEKMGQAY